MSSLTELGGQLFIMMIFVNFFAIAFLGYELQGTFTSIVGDENVTAETTISGQPSLSTDIVSQDAGDPSFFDFIIETVGGTLTVIYNFVYAALFGFADIAEQMKFPNVVMIAIVYPLKIFMFIYGGLLGATIINLLFRGGSSAGI